MRTERRSIAGSAVPAVRAMNVALAVAMVIAIATMAVSPQRQALALEGDLAAGYVGTQADDAAEPEVVATGYCTANPDALWTLDSEGTLTFSLKEGAASTIIGGTNGQGPAWVNDIEWNGTYRGKGVTSGHPSVSEVKSVVVSDGITGVKSGYFSNLRQLVTVRLPEGITEMTSLFQACTSLESVNVPSTVKTMYYCFVNCYSLWDVGFASNSSLTSVGGNSFYGCSSLESLDIPASVVSVGSEAFAYCTALKSVTWPAGCAAVPALCFDRCSSLVSFDCPDGVTSIGNAAFRGCSSLERIAIPDSCTSITAVQDNPKSGSFNGCTALGFFTLGDESHFAFEDGKLVRKADGVVVFDKANPDPQMFVYSTDNKDIEDLVVEAGISHFADAAFRDCYGIRSIAVEDGNLSFCVGDDGCLYTMDMTELVKAPNTLVSYEPPASLARVCPYAFQGCAGLQAVDFSRLEGLDRLEEGCFNGCAALEEVKLPDCVTYIGAGAFAGTSIESFRVPAQLWAGHEGDYQSFFCYDPTVSQRSPNGAGIFFGADSQPQGPANAAPVKEVDMSAYDRSFIPPYMFAGLENLESITIPASVTTVETGAFYECKNLKRVTCLSQTIDIAGAGETGDSTLGWSASTPPAFGSFVEETRGFSLDADKTFYGLAYSENDVARYCAAGNGTFMPIVYLGGMSDNELAATFGDPQGWDDYDTLACTFEKDGKFDAGMKLTATFLDSDVVPRQLQLGIDYSVACVDASGAAVSSIEAPGSYTLTVTGNGSDVLGSKTFKFTRQSEGAANAPAKTTAKLLANPMTAKAKTVKAKAAKKTTVKAKKAFVVKNAKGKVTFKKVSGSKKITVSKTGKVTVKKGLKKGRTYKVKVKVTAAGNASYMAKSVTVTLKVRVR